MSDGQIALVEQPDNDLGVSQVDAVVWIGAGVGLKLSASDRQRYRYFPDEL